MAFWMIAAMVATTAVTVGVGVAGMVEGQKATDKALKNQEEWGKAQAYVEYGQSLLTGPSAVPT